MANSEANSQLALSLLLDDSARFENFYTPEGSPQQACVRFLENLDPGGMAWIWGASGSGVSHLLQSCCNTFAPDGIYLPLVELAGEDPRQVLADLEHNSLLVFDDVGLVTGADNWSEQLFFLFNRLKDSGSRLVVGAKSPPQAIDTRLEDLRSRFASMTCFHIETLTDENKAELLSMRAANRGLFMPHAVATYLINHYSRDLSRQIELLDRLDVWSLQAKRRLTIPLVRDALENFQ